MFTREQILPSDWYRDRLKAQAASIALHAAVGFRHVGTLTEVGEKFGRLLDVVYMQRGEDDYRSIGTA